MNKHYNQLSAEERDQIALLTAKGLNKTKIAEQLDRHKSTITRELKRNNSFLSGGARAAVYLSSQAQQACEERRRKARQRPRLKNDWLREYTHERIHSGWTPERISGRLSLEHPNTPEKNISHEAVYQWLYSTEADPQLKALLPRGHKKRGRGDGRGRKKLKIAGRISIHERPKRVDNRSEFGHWEGDSVVGPHGSGGIHTEVERVSRFLMAAPIHDKKATTTISVQTKLFSALPAQARLSVTLDNGYEFARHQELHSLGIKTWFADPYSSWQRGSNENANGLIRRSYPKQTDFSQLEAHELAQTIKKINNLPRKYHGWRSAREVFATLHEKAGVALTC